MMTNEIMPNNIFANNTVSSTYDSHCDPFSPAWLETLKSVDYINIPLSKISRITHTLRYMSITSPEYHSTEHYARQIFTREVEGEPGQLSKSDEPPAFRVCGTCGECKKVAILTSAIGMVQISDGLLKVFSKSHPDVNSQTSCSKYMEKGPIACEECHQSWSDNPDIEDDEISDCPLAKGGYIPHEHNDGNDEFDETW